MVEHELPGDEPDVELPGEDVDGSDGFIADATGQSYDELADRAQAVIDRAHEMQQPAADTDGASEQTESAAPASDADE